MKALSVHGQIPHTTLSRTLYDTLWKRLKEIYFRGQEGMGILYLVPGWGILIEPQAAGNLQRDRFLPWGSSWRLTTRRLSLIGSIAWKPSAPDRFHEAQRCLLCDVYEWNLFPKSSSWFEKKKKPGRMSHWRFSLGTCLHLTWADSKELQFLCDVTETVRSRKAPTTTFQPPGSVRVKHNSLNQTAFLKMALLCAVPCTSAGKVLRSLVTPAVSMEPYARSFE